MIFFGAAERTKTQTQLLDFMSNINQFIAFWSTMPPLFWYTLSMAAPSYLLIRHRTLTPVLGGLPPEGGPPMS